MPLDLKDERTWADALAEIRWPNGFFCHQCERVTACRRHGSRPRTFICVVCRTSRSVTAGTLMHRTRLPLRYWFFAAALLADGGISSRYLARVLAVHVETAWQLAQRLRTALPPDRAELDGMVSAMQALIVCRPPPNRRGAEQVRVVIAAEDAPACEGLAPRAIVQPIAGVRAMSVLGAQVRGDVVVCGSLLRSIALRAVEVARKREGQPLSHRHVQMHADLLRADTVLDPGATGLPFTARAGEPVGARRALRELGGFLLFTHGTVSRAWIDGYLREFVARSRGGGRPMRRALLAHALHETPCRFDDLVRARRAVAARLQ